MILNDSIDILFLEIELEAFWGHSLHNFTSKREFRYEEMKTHLQVQLLWNVANILTQHNQNRTREHGDVTTMYTKVPIFLKKYV